MKKTVVAFSFLTLTNGHAFNTVTEVLPSGKLLICKETNQVRRGDIVEVQKRVDPKSLSNYDTTKASEFKLPGLGTKVKLTHKDFHPAGKKSNYHSEELGTAVISGESLEGEERLIITLDNSRFARRVEKRVTITKEQAAKLQSDCLVAIPENGLKVEESTAVSWE